MTASEVQAGCRRSLLHFYRPFPGALAALRELRDAGWRACAVTNGGPAQLAKLRATGPKEAVDGWCVSGLPGFAKPDPRMFAEAARRCGASGRWLVGDSDHDDIGGAGAAGLRSAWIRRGRDWPAHLPYIPDAQVDTVADAVSLLLSDTGPGAR
jgi:putative hydrolase of the HAD superfamily